MFISLNTLSVKKHQSNKINFVVSISTFLGILFAGFMYDFISFEIQTALLGFILGGLLFSILRH